MPSYTSITVPQLSRLVGLPGAPAIIDVRTSEDFGADPRRLPASERRDGLSVTSWAHEYPGAKAVIVCQKGQKLSEGTAAWLRHEGVEAEVLEGGFEAWREARALLVSTKAMPPRDDSDRTVWVTRARPKVDRTACPWLIRRFIDPKAAFLFVAASEVELVAQRFKATPFDIDGVFWTHRGDRCTFDTLIDEFCLASAPLARLATIIRAADTAKLDLAPQAPGVLAALLGLSRMFRDDLEQLDASFLVYDALYRWCRDAVEETHDWPNPAKA